MEWILKTFNGSALYSLISLGLIQLGNALKNKDENSTGADDEAGNICLALAPAISSLDGNNENARRKALRVVRDTIDNYLRSPA